MNILSVNPRSKTQNFQWYLLGISFLFCVISMLFFEKIMINDGLGWDGRNYFQMALNFQERFANGGFNTYYLKRSLPCAFIYYFLNVLNETRVLAGFVPLKITSELVIACFSLLNTFAIIASNYYLFKIYNKFEFEKKLQILCFILFNLSFIVSKIPSYYPILTDHFAIFIAVSMFYAYLFSRNYYLLALFFVGYFTFPTLFVTAACLFIFPYKKTERQLPKFSNKQIMYSLAIFLLIFIIFLLISIFIMVDKWESITDILIYNKKIVIDTLNNKRLSSGESPINTFFVPLAMLFSLIYIVTILLYFNIVLIFKEIMQQIQVKKLILIGIFVVSLSLLIKYYFPLVGFSSHNFLINIVKQTIKQPLAFFYCHFFYFGIAFIIPFIYYQYTKKVFEKIGLGAILVLLFHLFLMIGSESRQFLAVFPIFIVLSGLIIKNYLSIDNKIIIIIGIISFILSTIWLPINQTADYKPLITKMPYMYAIHQGPWMPTEFYYIVLIPFSLLIILLLKFKLKSIK